MAENFQDYVSYGGSTLADLGDAIVIGGTNTNAASKSVVFNNSGTSGALVWGPSANRTISLPDASGVALLSSQGILSVSAGGAQVTSGQLLFSNNNGVSFGINGQTFTASVASQTNDTAGFYAIGNTTQNSSTTFDIRTLSFNGLGNITVGFSNGSIQISGAGGGGGSPNFSAGTTSGNLASVVFSNSNNVSFGLNGSTITATVTVPAQSNQTVGLYALGNTTQNSSTTLDARTLSYNAAGAITMGYSNGSIQVSAAQTSSLVGVGGLVVSTNGSTISVSGPTLTNYEPQAIVNTATFGPGQNTWYLEPFEIPGNISGGRINQVYSFSSSSGTAGNFVLTGSASYGTGTSGSIGNGYTFIKNLALYSLDVGTNSTRLASFWSNSMSFALSRTMSISQAGGTAISLSLGISMSYVVSVGTNGSYTTTQLTSTKTTSTASSVMNTTAVSSFYSSFYNMLNLPGGLIIPVGFNTTIQPGNYWLALMQSTTSATSGTNLGLFVTSNMINFTLPTISSYRVWGQTTSVNSALAAGAGSFSATSASPPTTINFTAVNTLATRQYFHFLNSTI
jgi:hypothetical protein